MSEMSRSQLNFMKYVLYVLLCSLPLWIGLWIYLDKGIFLIALMGGILGLFFFIEPKVGVILLILSVFIFDWLHEVAGFIPKEATWVSELVIFILFLRVYIQTMKSGRVPKIPMNKPICILVVLGIISAIFNDVSPFVTFLGFRNYFKYVLLFYIVASLDFNEAFLRGMLKFILCIAFLQIPIAVIQRFYYIPLAGDVITGDVVGGTLGASTSGLLTIFLLCLVSLFIGFYYYYPGKRILCLLGIGLLFIPMGLNETKVTFFLAPLLILFFMRRIIFRSPAKALAVLIIGSTLIVSTYRIYNHFFSERFDIDQFLFSPQYLKEYLLTEHDKDGGLRRIPSIIFANRQITADLPHTFIGVGPGNASDSFFPTGKGSYYKRFEDLKIDKIFISRMLFEFGYLGVSLFLFLVYTLYRENKRRKHQLKDNFWRAVSFGFEGIMFIMLVTTVYINSFIAESLAFTFWFVAGSLMAVQRESTAR